MAVPSVLQLSCSCNEYPWGKVGSDSLAAKLCSKTPGWGGEGPPTKFSLDEKKPYSEMWLGTYPDLPSYVLATGQNLQDLIDKNVDQLLGQEVRDKFGHSNLPFLPKILSAGKALPLQLHPNKEIAAQLHKEDPQNFTDPNHKPEIALALTDFEAFAGFKPLETIQKHLQLEPLQRFVPKDSSGFTNDTLREVVRTILKAEDNEIKDAVTGLQKLPASAFGSETYIQKMIPRLAEQYDKTDPGILVALVTMNYMQLKPGECISVPADGIHAWLKGDIVECMARSNNVLNTGFCPRGDRNSADLFCKCLTFNPHSPEEAILKPKPYPGSKNGKTIVFRPDINEFNILTTKLGAGDKEVIAPINGPAIAFSTEGEGVLSADGDELSVKEGSVWFVGKGTEVRLASDKGLTLHFAYADPST